MTAKTLRAAAMALTFTMVAAFSAPARATEQDTANGVAPVRPGQAAEAPAAPVVPPAPAGQPTPAAQHASATPPDNKPPGSGGEAQRYCDNIAAVAAEARFAWQTRKLNELQGQVTSRIAELEKKQAELEASLARRDEAMRKARDTLVAVYAKMDPEAAAGQLAVLDDGLAAAVLVQLTPKQSSLILDEIKPERAGQLVAAMTSLPAPDAKPDGKKS